MLNEVKNASVSSSVASSDAGAGDFNELGVEHGEGITPRKL